jgi:ADP-ribose pyrophosphatase YjhB (NUDIX family)
MKKSTLVFVLQDIDRVPHVLLALKTRKLGQDLWNGYGGKLEKDETIRGNAVSETKVESSVVIKEEDLEHVAILRGHFKQEVMGSMGWEVFIFLTRKWTGKPEESAEMREPTWFATNLLPEKIIESDKEWWSRVLSGEKLLIEVFFGNDERSVERTVIQPLTEFV